jgi:hypothetical protein
VYHDDDGMVIVRARLEPQAGAVLVQAIAAARDALYARHRAKSADVPAGTSDGSAGPQYADGSPEAPTWQQQEADALALIAETALHHGIVPGNAGERYQVVVHVDAAVLADANASGQSVLEDSAYVPAETSQRLACDASRVVMRHDADGRITEVGARTRTIPPALRRALEHRDKGCYSARDITSDTGRMAVPRRYPTSRCCVAAIIVRSTKKDFRWSDKPTASCGSGGRMAI